MVMGLDVNAHRRGGKNLPTRARKQPSRDHDPELRRTPLERHGRLAALIPASTLTIIEDCGHMSTLEQPEAVNAALRWWLTQ